MDQSLVGVAAAPGVRKGSAFLWRRHEIVLRDRPLAPAEISGEIERFRAAEAAARQQLAQLEEDVRQRLGKEQADILAAQQMMLADPTLAEGIITLIEGGTPAERACLATCEEQANLLRQLDDAYLAERAADVLDIGQRLCRCLQGADAGAGGMGELPEGAVLVAEDLAPSDTAALDMDKVAAVVLDKGGKTSHTAIICRSMGLPAVVGTASATAQIRDGDLLVVNGDAGTVTINPPASVMAEFERADAARQAEDLQLEIFREHLAHTADGRRVEVAANIGGPAETAGVLAAGAEGIGLFRTEFLFLHRESQPTEEEQFEAYKAVLSAMAPRPVIVRTLDIGGDKAIPYLPQPAEENPFLGVRAIRLCLQQPELFGQQLRALLRASVYGDLRIMFPMISHPGELRAAKAALAQARAELEASGVAVAQRIPVGIMIEIPSAAVCADLLAPECDFFSIGTNDLVQYTMAADRGNPSLASLTDAFHPAVLRLIAYTVEAGHRCGIPVGMCGEMAGLPEAVPLLVGMGLDELSMAGPAILRAKALIARAESGEFARVWEQVRSLSTAEAVHEFLRNR